MRVAVAFSCPLDGPTGSPMRLRALLEALDRDGARVPLVRISGLLGPPARGRAGGRDLLTTSLAAFPAVAARVWRRERVGAVLAVQETAAVAAWPVAWALGLPLVYDYHGAWDAEDELRHHRRRRRTAVKVVIERRLMRSVHRTVVLSMAVRDELAAAGVPADRLDVVYPGVPEASLAAWPEPASIPGLLGEHLAVLYAGNFQPYQGLPLLVDAMRRVVAREPRARLVVVGGTREQYQQAAGTLDPAPWALFLGRKPHEEIPGLLARADVLTIPRPPSRISQTTATKLVEYLAAGRALAVTDVADHRLLVGRPGAGVVTAPAAEALADGLLSLLTDPGRRAAAGEAGRRVARDLTCERQYGRLAHLVEEAADGVRG